VIGIAAAVALFRFKVGVIQLIGTCAALAWAWSLIGPTLHWMQTEQVCMPRAIYPQTDFRQGD